MTINILCFGDSNTWGLNPATGKRFDLLSRWTSQLAAKLGSGFSVVEAGQPNRSLVNTPPFDGVLSGVSYLKPYLEDYVLDIIIIGLGTNDLKKRFGLTPEYIAQGLDNLIADIFAFYSLNNKPKIVILSPAYVRCVGQYKGIYEGAECKNLRLKNQFEKVALNKACLFYDLQGLVSVSVIDGVHIDKSQHTLIAEKLYDILGETPFGA
jgi:lysophospholipase L1-like esterase